MGMGSLLACAWLKLVRVLSYNIPVSEAETIAALASCRRTSSSTRTCKLGGCSGAGCSCTHPGLLVGHGDNTFTFRASGLSYFGGVDVLQIPRPSALLWPRSAITGQSKLAGSLYSYVELVHVANVSYFCLLGSTGSEMSFLRGAMMLASHPQFRSYAKQDYRSHRHPANMCCVPDTTTSLPMSVLFHYFFLARGFSILDPNVYVLLARWQHLLLSLSLQLW